jgi:hypothetical protein
MQQWRYTRASVEECRTARRRGGEEVI